MTDDDRQGRMTEAGIRVLLVEDDANDAELMLYELRQSGFSPDWQRVSSEADYLAALDAMPDVILADYTMPRFGAKHALSLLKERGHDIPFIVVTGSIGEERAVECMREGAADYLLKDRLTRLGPAVKRVLEELAIRRAKRAAEEERDAAFLELERLKQAAERERDYLREEADDRYGEIVGSGPVLSRVLELVAAVAPTKSTVLVCGESGVGKELIARAIHAKSDRAKGPLVRLNCASIPAELFESELFGHVKGSFTGAHRNRTGRFELADGGTIFLDEIGEVPLELQAKLLRILQESEFERVGDDRTRRVDVRVVAATNRNLEEDVLAGKFRRDLYYRLTVFPLEVPPLRERREDIGALAAFFLGKFCRAIARPVPTIEPEQRALLERYSWPGNIRELQHVIERAVILARGSALEFDGLLGVVEERRVEAASGAIMTDDELRALEQKNLLAALERAGWRIGGAGGAAELLGVHPSTLRDRMKALGVQRRS